MVGRLVSLSAKVAFSLQDGTETARNYFKDASRKKGSNERRKEAKTQTARRRFHTYETRATQWTVEWGRRDAAI